MVGLGCVPLPVASQTLPARLQKSQKHNQTRLHTSWSLLCQVLLFRNRLRPGLWSTMATEEYICGFWVHIHFAVCGNAVALLNQHLSRASQMKGELDFKNLKEGVLKCTKFYDLNIVDTFLQQGRKNIKVVGRVSRQR